MDEEQKRKFEKWYANATDMIFTEMLTMKYGCMLAWQACLEANKVEEQEPEPTPTEMVRRLLEKGWEVEQGTTKSSIFFKYPPSEGWMSHSLQYAYRKAFPRKKRVEVEVWMDTKNKRHPITDCNMSDCEDWTKGTATFWVEEEQPCSEDGSS